MRELWATGLAWLAGIALLQGCERMPSAPEHPALAGASLLLLLLRRRHMLALAGCVALLAFTQAALRAERRLRHEPHPAWEGRDLVLAGRIYFLLIAVTDQGGVPGWRFEFAVEGVGSTGVTLSPEMPRRLMLDNLVASFVVTPLALAGGLFPPLRALAMLLIQALTARLRLLVAWSAAECWLLTSPVWSQAPALLGAVLVALRLPWRLRLAGGAMMCRCFGRPCRDRPRASPSCCPPTSASATRCWCAPPGMRCYSTPARPMRPAPMPAARIAAAAAQPVRAGLDMLMLSHRDGDHVGGAATLQGLPMAELRSSLAPGHPLRRAGPPSCVARSGRAGLGLGRRALRGPAPLPARYGAGLKSNDLSRILRITAASGRRGLLARALEAGIAVVPNPSCGGWRWQSNGQPYAGTCERERRQRHWRDRATPAPGLAGPPVDETHPPEPELSF